MQANSCLELHEKHKEDITLTTTYIGWLKSDIREKMIELGVNKQTVNGLAIIISSFKCASPKALEAQIEETYNNKLIERRRVEPPDLRHILRSISETNPPKQGKNSDISLSEYFRVTKTGIHDCYNIYELESKLKK